MVIYKMNLKFLSCFLVFIFLINYVDGFKLGSVGDEKALNSTHTSLQVNTTYTNLANNTVHDKNTTLNEGKKSSQSTDNVKQENIKNLSQQVNGTTLKKTVGVLPNLNDFDSPLNYSYAASMLYPYYTKFYIEPTAKPKSRISKRLARPANFVMQRKQKYFDVDPVPGEEDEDDTKIKEDANSKKQSEKLEKESKEVGKSVEDDESEENSEKYQKQSRVSRNREEQEDEGEDQEEDGENDEDYEDEEEEEEGIKEKIIKESKEDAIDLSEDEANVDYALSLSKNTPNAPAKLVVDSEAEGSKKEVDHVVDFNHEKGGGKKHNSEHHGEHGEHGEKGYKGFHKDTKSAKGHHDKEAHKHHYADRGGHDKQHHEEQGHHGEHHQGEKGNKHAEYEESGQHSKGHSTKGSHDIHKKDEYEKKVTFFEEDGDSGEEEKYGGFSSIHEHGKGGEYHKGHHASKDFQGEKGDEKYFTEGGHHMDNQGHKKADGHSGYHSHHLEHGNKNGRDGGKKWGYAKGLGGDHQRAKIIQHRSDKGDLGHDGQASEHRGVIQKPKQYITRSVDVHPFVEGAAFIQQRVDNAVEKEELGSNTHTNAYNQFPLKQRYKPNSVKEGIHLVQRRMDDVEENPGAEQDVGVENEQIVNDEPIVENEKIVENEQKVDKYQKIDSGHIDEKGIKNVQVVKYEEEFENEPTDTVQETTKYRGYLVNEHAVESKQFGEHEPLVQSKDGNENETKVIIEQLNRNNEQSLNQQEIKSDKDKESENVNSQEPTEQIRKPVPELESSDHEPEDIQEVEESVHHINAKIVEDDEVIKDYPEDVRTELKREDVDESDNTETDHKEENFKTIEAKVESPEKDAHAHTPEEKQNPGSATVEEEEVVAKNKSNPFIFDDYNEENTLYDEIVTRNNANDVSIPDDTEAQTRRELLQAEQDEYIRLAALSRGNITVRGPRSTEPTENKESLGEVEKLPATELTNNSTMTNIVKRSKKRSKKGKSKKNKKKKTSTTETPEVQEDNVPERPVAGDSADFF